jgi:DNA uptake protein ComE-like DNA-binding protein
MTTSPKTTRSNSRRGSALVLVLIVISVLTLTTFTFARRMLTENKASRVHGRALQSAALAESGLEYLRVYLRQDRETIEEAGGLYDNPQRFQAILAIDDEQPEGRGRFGVLAPLISDEGSVGVRFGLEDESARLNLNVLLVADQQEENGGRTLLMALPGMTESIADAILDWIDEDDEPREYGAELDYYSGLDPAYSPKNGALETVEELLLVRDVTPQMLFGADINRNGMLDAHEGDGATVAGIDNSTGELTRGWSGYLTLSSMEKNVRPDGSPKINLNLEDMEELYEQLEEALGREMATFIVAYRQNGPFEGTGGGAVEKAGRRKLDLTKPGAVPLTTLLDLIGPNVRVAFPDAERPVVLQTPFLPLPVPMAVYLPLLMDNVSVNPSPVIPGRININQAPRTILAGIPGMTDEILEKIISNRTPEVTSEDRGRRYETWILTESVVTLDEMKQLIPYINAGGDVYRAQLVGYYDRLGPAARAEVVIDATESNPRIVQWRDLSYLGRGYSLETLGIEVSE